jgi:hypothetical protein
MWIVVKLGDGDTVRVGDSESAMKSGSLGWEIALRIAYMCSAGSTAQAWW